MSKRTGTSKKLRRHISRLETRLRLANKKAPDKGAEAKNKK